MNKSFINIAFAACFASGAFALGSASAFADCTPASIDPSCPLSQLSPTNPQNLANIAVRQAQQQEQQRIIQQQQAVYNSLSPQEKCEQARQSPLCGIGIICEPIGADCGRYRRAR